MDIEIDGQKGRWMEGQNDENVDGKRDSRKIRQMDGQIQIYTIESNGQMGSQIDELIDRWIEI